MPMSDGKALYRDRAQAAIAGFAGQTGEGRGATLIVSGRAGSGVGVALDAVSDVASECFPGNALIRGHFENGSYVADTGSETDGGRSNVRRLAEVGAWLSPWLGPLGAMINQLLQTAVGAWKLLERAELQGASPAPLMRAAVRHAARESPLVLVLERCDEAPAMLWFDFFDALAREANVDLPVFLVIGTGHYAVARGTGEQSAEEQPEWVAVVRQLVEGEVANSWTMARLDLRGVEVITGPATDDVRAQLLQVTGGEAGWMIELWEDWRTSGAVREGADRQWRFADRGRTQALAGVDDILRRRLAERSHDESASALAHVRRVLAVAALEGRQFTAEAVAVACQEDRDAVVDLLDDLAAEDARAPALLFDIGGTEVEGARPRRHLWRYRFGSEMHWLSLKRYGLGRNERSRMARSLAESLDATYDPEQHRVAHVITRLCEEAGDMQAARYWRRRAHVITEWSLLRAEADLVLRNEAQWASWDQSRQRFSIDLLLAAYEPVARRETFEVGIRLLQAAERLAVLRRDDLRRARAVLLRGQHLFRIGSYREAGEAAATAISLFEATGDRGGKVLALKLRATVEAETGDARTAASTLGQVLPIQRRLGDRVGIASTTHELGRLAFIQGETEEALKTLSEALKLWRAVHHPRGEADTLTVLGQATGELGQFDISRQHLERACAIIRGLGDKRAEADVEHGLGVLAHRVGDIEAAKRHLERQLQLADDLGDRVSRGFALHHLGAVAATVGDYATARQMLSQALEIRRTTGDPVGVGATLQEIGELDLKEGRLNEAEALFHEALSLVERAGHRRGAASVHQSLAKLELERGHTAAAREELLKALGEWRALVDPRGERETLNLLSRIPA